MSSRSMVLILVVACAFAALSCGPGEGDECTNNDDCSSGLICQPIKGRPKTYCCPTPPDSSTKDDCHAVP